MNVSRSLIKRSQAATWADAHGWDLTLTKGQHLRARCPTGCCLVIISHSSSDHRGDRNAIALMRRCPDSTKETA